MQKHQSGVGRASELTRFQDQQFDSDFQLLKMRHHRLEDLLRDTRRKLQDLTLLVADESIARRKVVKIQGTENLLVLNPVIDLAQSLLGQSARQIDIARTIL